MAPAEDGFDDDFRDGRAVVLPQHGAARPHAIDRNVISDTSHVRHPSRIDEHRPGLVREGRTMRREPERQGIQDRRPGRVRMAAVVPDVEWTAW